LIIKTGTGLLLFIIRTNIKFILLSEFHFLRPLWLVVIPVLWWMIYRLLRRWLTKGNWDQVADAHLLAFLVTKPAKGKRSLLPWIICLAGTLLLLALSGPVWKKNQQPLLQKSLARVLVLDLSYSMLATDIKPTRFERARFKLKDLLKHFDEGETALVVYAGDAFVISPLTHDPANISALLPGVHPNIMPLPGSRADLAIELAAGLLSKRNNGTGHIIWVTDGIEEKDIRYTKNAIGLNRLSILSVGTESGSPIPLSGGGFLKDINGGIVIPKLYLKPLKRLANQTHGTFTVLSADDSDVEQIVASEKIADDFVEDKQERTSDKWNEEGPWLLLLALPFSAFLFRRGLLFSICFTFLIGLTVKPSSTMAFGWDDIWLRADQQAYKLFKQGETKKAAELFENPEWKGTAEFRSGNYEKAIEHFSQQNNSRSNFNIGNALAFTGRLQEALDVFKNVLIENPQDSDAQFNHDLIKKLIEDQKGKKRQQSGQKHSNENNKLNQKNRSSKEKKINNGKDTQGSLDEDNGHEENIFRENLKKDGEKKTISNKNHNLNKRKKANTKNVEIKKKSYDQNKKENAKNNEPDSTQADLANQQFIEQWLRKIPDDPGRLLRNKMEREFQRRGKQKFKNEQYW